MIFKRRARLGAVVAAVVVLSAVTALLLVPPRYRATASIVIDPSGNQILPTASASDGDQAAETAVNTEMEIIGSRTVARTVVDRFDLADDPEFSSRGREEARGQASTGSLAEAEELDDRTLAALKEFREHVQVTRRGLTNLVDVTVDSRNPRKAAQLANAVADAYVAISRGVQVADAGQQSDSLVQQLERLGNELREADAAVARYRGATGITSSTTAGTATEQQLQGVAGQLAIADAQAGAARARLNAAQAQVERGGINSVNNVLSSPVITELRRQRAEAVRDQSRISSVYGPRHPESERAAQQLSELDAEIRGEAERILAGLQGEAAAAEASAGRLRAELNALRGQQSTDARAAVEATSLERAAEAKREIYNQLAMSAQQTQQQERLGQSPGRIAERALPPVDPYFPNKKLLGALALVFGGALGVTVMLLAEVLDRGVRTAKDVEDGLNRAFLGAAPVLTPRDLKKAGLGPDQVWDYVVARPMSPFAEAMRTVRAAVFGAGKGERRKVVAVTSAVPGEGKSVLAVSLARVMAMGGDRVVLVDCDLRHASLTNLRKASPAPGLLEVLKGESELEAALTPDVENLSVLSLARAEFALQNHFSREQMKTLLRMLRDRFDYVVLDAPPVMLIADAVAIAALADTSILVVRWGETAREAALRALEQLDQASADVAGAVITQTDTSARSLTKSDAAYYYYSDAGSIYFKT